MPQVCGDELLALLGVELAELGTELFELEEVVATELELVGVFEHTAPVIAGTSAVEPFLSPCTPKLTDWPGWMVLFQSNAVAEYGLAPDKVAFHELVILLLV